MLYLLFSSILFASKDHGFMAPWSLGRPAVAEGLKWNMPWNANERKSNKAVWAIGSHRQPKIKDPSFWCFLCIKCIHHRSSFQHGKTMTDITWLIFTLLRKSKSTVSNKSRPRSAQSAFQMHSAETRSTAAGMPRTNTATVERLSVMGLLFCVCDMDPGTSTDLFQHVSTNCSNTF